MRWNMGLLSRAKQEADPMERRFKVISDLTKDLERREFNCLMDAIRSMFEARQKLKSVKTKEEKEGAIVDDISASLMEDIK